MNLPKDLDDMLSALLPRIHQALGGNLVGVYVRGSLATGDFMPDTSDVDLLGVTERPVNAPEFAALVALHARVAALPHPYAHRVEIAYIGRAAVRRFEPGLRHPTLGQGKGEALVWTEHRSNWILERWTVREHGVALLGPDPRTLIDPVSSDDLRAAVRAELDSWADWAAHPEDPGWVATLGAQRYVVETMCRALHTISSGGLSSKQSAVAWALGALPEPWRATVKQSQVWRGDRSDDPTIVSEVMRFVRWAATAYISRRLAEVNEQW